MAQGGLGIPAGDSMGLYWTIISVQSNSGFVIWWGGISLFQSWNSWWGFPGVASPLEIPPQAIIYRAVGACGLGRRGAWVRGVRGIRV